MGVEIESIHSKESGFTARTSPLDGLFSSLHAAKEALLPSLSVRASGSASFLKGSNTKLADSVNDTTYHCIAGEKPVELVLTNNKVVTTCNPHDGTSTMMHDGQFSAVSFQVLSHKPSILDEGTTGSHSIHGFHKKNPKQYLPHIEFPKQFTSLSLQGLTNFVPMCCMALNPACLSEKANSICVLNVNIPDIAQKLSVASLLRLAMNYYVFASSNISKQAMQVVPWNFNLMYTISLSKQKMVGYLNETLCISLTLESCNPSQSSHKEDAKSKFNAVNCFKPADLGFAHLGEDLNAPNSSSNGNRNSSVHSPNSQLAMGLFRMPIPNIERLRSTFSRVSLTEIMELIPQLGKTSQDFPDKKKLFSVQDFFKYTESEGRRFFEELDRDNDGQVTLEDLEAAMRKRRLPQKYAREFLRRTRKHWFAKSFGWSEFLTLMEQKEPMMLRAYNSLNLSKSGTLQKSQVLSSLRSAGLPATEENAAAMMRCLDADTSGSIAYGHFRNLMLLLPPERLGDDPRMVWFETATVVPMAPPVAVPAGNVLKSALAGGLACALSTSMMHPIDTMKTRVQASSSISFPDLISKLPEIGIRGLYRGSIPAILGQFSSHGLRTGIFEASKLLLVNLSPSIPEFQVQSLASFFSTMLGTAMRIPCEVLKQRLQAGIFDSVGDAIIGTWQKDGPRGFFRGTGATLCREVPFYVAGMGIYAEAKKVIQQLLNRELAPWETIAVGAMSGGLAAVFTTPFDVMKTRAMTAAPGSSTRMSTIAITIVREEGLLGLFKGAVPRFFWIAPLGAMNFAGYELAKRAIEKED